MCVCISTTIIIAISTIIIIGIIAITVIIGNTTCDELKYIHYYYILPITPSSAASITTTATIITTTNTTTTTTTTTITTTTTTTTIATTIPYLLPHHQQCLLASPPPFLIPPPSPPFLFHLPCNTTTIGAELCLWAVDDVTEGLPVPVTIFPGKLFFGWGTTGGTSGSSDPPAETSSVFSFVGWSDRGLLITDLSSEEFQSVGYTLPGLTPISQPNMTSLPPSTMTSREEPAVMNITLLQEHSLAKKLGLAHVTLSDLSEELPGCQWSCVVVVNGTKIYASCSLSVKIIFPALYPDPLNPPLFEVLRVNDVILKGVVTL